MFSFICLWSLSAGLAWCRDASPAPQKALPKAVRGNETIATIRVGKHTDHTSIVFETTENYVQRASVIVTGDNTIKVDFQAPVTFRLPQKGPSKNFSTIDKGPVKGKSSVELGEGVRLTPGASSCLLVIDKLDDINVSKLLAPPRLVINAFIKKDAALSSGKDTGSPAQDRLPVPPDMSDVKMELFMLDAGHGGYDSGIRSGSKTEKDIALMVTKDLAGALGKKGKKVFLTRKSDQVMTLRERIRAVNQKQPEIFLSIHVSSKNEFCLYTARKKAEKDAGDPQATSPENNAQGPDVKDRARAVAGAIARYVRQEFKMKVRYERLPLRVISSVNAPAILIELPNPEKFTYDGKTRERLVNAILKGIAYSSMS